MVASPYVVGIGGGTGSGKTTIATTIAESVDSGITLLSLDNYYRSEGEVPTDDSGRRNFDHPDAVDWDLLVDHLGALTAGEQVAVPQYDFDTFSRRSTRTQVDPEPFVILEGIFALYHEGVLDELDLAVYVQTDADVRFIRRLQRDISERGRTVDGVIDRYLSTVKPMHQQFVAPTKREADLIIPEGANSAAIGLLREKVESEVDARATDAESEP